MWYSVAGALPPEMARLLRWFGMGLTVVKSDRVIQAAQLLQSGMHHPCSVTGNRQCLRLSIMTYGSQPLLVPVTRVKWDRSNVSALHQARWEVSEAGTFTVQGSRATCSHMAGDTDGRQI